MSGNERQFVMLLILAIGSTLTASCEREARDFSVSPANAQAPENVPVNDSVRPGPMVGATSTSRQPAELAAHRQEPFAHTYANNAQAMSDGQTLYEMYNCVGCHAHGAGGIAPPLLDRKWFYGSEPAQVYTSIVEGRPNGMPSFRGRIPDYQVWELVAYVRSMSGQASPNAASGRDDHMSGPPPPNSMPKVTPEQVPEPTTGPTTGHVTG